MATYKGYYQTYDAGHIDEDGYVWIMSRTDDIINVAVHRLSTGEIEEVLAEHKDVAECAVIGIADKLKGQLPIGLLALKAGVTKDKKDIKKFICRLMMAIIKLMMRDILMKMVIFGSCLEQTI